MLRDLVVKNRSYPRFDQSQEIDLRLLEQLVALCRFCPSGRNLQPLKFMIINTPEQCGKVFPNLA